MAPPQHAAPARRRTTAALAAAAGLLLVRRAPLAFLQGGPTGAAAPLPRRAWATLALSCALPFACSAPGLAEEAAPVQRWKASKEELQEISGAFAKLRTDPKRENARQELESAEATFGAYIEKYRAGNRFPAEISGLHMGRARSRILQNDIAYGKRPEKAAEAVTDYDVAIGIMDADFKAHPEKPMYSEYPDALTRRALAKEEIKAWEGAVQDYTKAIEAWRPPENRPDIPLRGNAKPQEGDGLGVNPLVLNYRGNALCQLGKYDEALTDYQEATDIFLNDGEQRLASLSRANEALALFGAGERELAIKTMKSVVRKDPGVTDMHVALAATYWQSGRVGEAEGEWQFACENISTGCAAYKDLDWVTNIRRWPPNLVLELQAFLGRQ